MAFAAYESGGGYGTASVDSIRSPTDDKRSGFPAVYDTDVKFRAVLSEF